MKLPRKHFGNLAMLALVATFALVATNVVASPAITSAVIKPRIWNDDPTSVLTTGNTYANPGGGSIFIDDASLDADGGGGWANRHAWRFSENGSTEAVFLNGDGFRISADVTLSGSANIEAGLNVSPWWSKDVDGQFNVRTSDGEIAVFGGRLPFYSFTGSHGITYTKGETVTLAMTYAPRDLDAVKPAVIKYAVTMGAITYESGWLAFNEGNPAEDPPYGLWGILNDARVGGYSMGLINNADPSNSARADFDNISYVPEPATLALLAIGGVALLRRRSQ